MATPLLLAEFSAVQHRHVVAVLLSLHRLRRVLDDHPVDVLDLQTGQVEHVEGDLLGLSLA